MTVTYDFAIITPEHNNKNIVALKSFLEGYGLSVCLLPYLNESLDQVQSMKIGNVVVFNDDQSRYAVEFIVEASVRKMFHYTSFYHISESLPPQDEQIKLMTLGYMGFLGFPFSALEVQNTIDLFEATIKIA